MKVYEDYINTIKSAIALDSKSGFMGEAAQNLNASQFQKSLSSTPLNKSIANINGILPSMEELSRELGIQPNYDQRLGLHPDFGHLKYNNGIEKNYIVSMFVDIKGSTNLFKKYTPETVQKVTQTIQQAAIHTCLIFGGYVQRLHGDGLFEYFGGKQISQNTAVIRSLQSAGVFTYFIKNDLKKFFSTQGVENIYTRIGIDVGHKDDVVWYNAGISEISEITTCSLHTSLASKMQSSASSNGIVIGDNIRTEVLPYDKFFTPVCDRTGKDTDRYIFQITEERFNYTQYDFDLLNFLKQQDFIATDLYGDLSLRKKLAPNIIKKSEDIKPIAQSNKPYYGAKENFKNT